MATTINTIGADNPENNIEMKQIKLTTLTFGLLLFGCNEDY